ncbi:hypothetical protein B484DRAFT_444960 [Ochromonadaceae sp. CCMP2298]|nr:hypothetical protein B484DRAFT_444960 [Ochromonadaceae sp. CCMP2298]|mmetsp:Transcript_9121/g.20096  ORF Transcript_9121/g.20096 Transcript_9121/m.20096 type:complete len:426 (-) Transcript_9121:178-1455(-)
MAAAATVLRVSVISVLLLVSALRALATEAEEVAFLGYRFRGHEWEHLKAIVKCWGEKGAWRYKANVLLVTEGLDQFQARLRRFSPCHNAQSYDFYGKQRACYWVFDSNTSNYEWALPDKSCHGFGGYEDKFEVDNVCDIMRHSGGNMMIVGDSLMYHFGLSLMNLAFRGPNMPYPDHDACNAQYDGGVQTRVGGVAFPCGLQNEPGDKERTVTLQEVIEVAQRNGPAPRLFVARNDHLTLMSETVVLPQYTYSDWISDISRNNISLILMNRGAHYEDDDKLLSGLNASLHYVRTQHPHISIIWRNTPYGHHSYAGQFTLAPLQQPIPNSELGDSPLGDFSYRHFEHQNKLVEAMIQTHYPEVLVMDVFTATVLRVDSHADPVHYCTPSGAYNNWVFMLGGAMRLVSEYHKEVQNVKNVKIEQGWT